MPSPEEWAKREGWKDTKPERNFVYLTFYNMDNGGAQLVIRYKDQSLAVPFDVGLAKRLIDGSWQYIKDRVK